MPATVVWNRSGVPQEISSTPERIVFVRSRRLYALLFGGLAAGVSVLSLKLLWGTSYPLLGYLFSSFWGLIGILFLIDAMTCVWSQRMVVVDLGRREIQLMRRSLGRATRFVHPFSALREITVERPEEGMNSVLLSLESGTAVLLGRDFDEPAAAFARRISQLAKVPLKP